MIADCVLLAFLAFVLNFSFSSADRWTLICSDIYETFGEK